MINYVDEIKKALEYHIERDVVHASEIGKCIRQSWFYRNFVLPINTNSVSADLGVSIHGKVQEHFVKNYNCVAEQKVEKVVNGLRLIGKADLICGNELVELKTVQALPDAPYSTHLAQVAAYSMLFDNVQTFYIIYIQRDNGMLKQFVYTRQQLEDHRQFAVAWITALREALYHKDVRKVPALRNNMCRFCPFTAICV